MTFAGTRTRGNACGCCGAETCGICETGGNIAFCIRLTGVAAEGGGGSCADCTDMNTTFSGSSGLGGDLILRECNNCTLDDITSVLDDNPYLFPESIAHLRACYKATFLLFGEGAINIAILTCPSSTPSVFGYSVVAALLKPNQAGMGTDTTELHIRVINNSNLTVLHGKFEFTSIPFDCQDVDWTAMEIVDRYDESEEVTPVNECDWSVAEMEFKFGGECGNGSPAEDTSCCEGITLPGTLSVTTSGSGADVTDEPIFQNVVATGFSYDTATEEVLLELFCESGTALLSVNVFGGVNTNVPLSILSCDPFHAVGSAAGVDVEITA
jgi:hypothetical protein